MRIAFICKALCSHKNAAYFRSSPVSWFMFHFHKLADGFYRLAIKGGLVASGGEEKHRWAPGFRLTSIRPRSLWTDGVAESTFWDGIPWTAGRPAMAGLVAMSVYDVRSVCFKRPCEVFVFGVRDYGGSGDEPDQIVFPEGDAWQKPDKKGNRAISISPQQARVLAEQGKLVEFAFPSPDSAFGDATVQNMMQSDYESVGYYYQGTKFGAIPFSRPVGSLDLWTECNACYIRDLRGISGVGEPVSARKGKLLLSNFTVTDPGEAAVVCPWLKYVLPGTAITNKGYFLFQDKAAFAISIQELRDGLLTRNGHQLCARGISIHPEDIDPAVIKKPLLISSNGERVYLVADRGQLVGQRKCTFKDTSGVSFYRAVLAGTKTVETGATYCLASEAAKMEPFDRKAHARKIAGFKARFSWFSEEKLKYSEAELLAHDAFLNETKGDGWVAADKNPSLDHSVTSGGITEEILPFIASKYFIGNSETHKISPLGDESVLIPSYEMLRNNVDAWNAFVLILAKHIPFFSDIIQDPEAGDRFAYACLTSK